MCKYWAKEFQLQSPDELQAIIVIISHVRILYTGTDEVFFHIFFLSHDAYKSDTMELYGFSYHFRLLDF